MKLKSLLAVVFACIISLGAWAQNDISVGEITIINLGDGRILHRSIYNENPINGEHRIIDGHKPEYKLAEFKDGLYDGKYEHYKNNKLIEKGVYKEGRKNGTFFEYYSDGKIKSETSFANGKRDGLRKTYFTNGKPETVQGFKDGVEDGVFQKWDWETGELRIDKKYKDGKEHGKQFVYASSNIGDLIIVSHYENGVQTGEYSETWTNGITHEKGQYKDGKKDGIWLRFHKSGKPEASTTYKNGRLNGEFKTFFPNGTTVAKMVTYVNDEPEGLVNEFSPNSGKLKSEYYIYNRVKEGEYKMYYDDGTLQEEGLFENGSEVYRKEYYKNGQIKKISALNAIGRWDTIESYNEDGSQKENSDKTK